MLAYCLMDNHFHLAIKVAEIPLSKIMHRILTSYAMTFNLRHDRDGHLFQARYKAITCIDERYLLRLVDYIHNNPVRAGIVGIRETWPWSSAAPYRDQRRNGLVDPSVLPAYLGFTADDAGGDGFDPWNQEQPILIRPEPSESGKIESLAIECARELKIELDAFRSKRRDHAHVRARRRLVAEGFRQGIRTAEIARWLGCTPAAVHYLANRTF